MWIYSKAKDNYKIKWGQDEFTIKANQITEIPNEIAMAYFGYGYGADRDIDEREAKYLTKILIQRWALAGVNLKPEEADRFLTYNDYDNSIFFLAENYNEIQDMIKAKPTSTGK
jgi:hypothetical protein